MNINSIINGNCLDVLKTFPGNSFDSCVTDPPYGISFMNKKWDYDVPPVEVWHEVLRVVKPGAHILVACGTRTQHRMAVNIEDAGFEIRDVITWHYGSGFPKSLNLGDGKGTGLKPATEFWTMGRKPISEGSIIRNVEKFGTGGINIDDSRIPKKEGDRTEYGRDTELDYKSDSVAMGKFDKTNIYTPDEGGRWPSNVIMDEFSGEAIDRQSGFSETKRNDNPSEALDGNTWGGSIQTNRGARGYTDAGGASRFFYCPKPENAERNKGLEKMQFSKAAEHHMADVCETCGKRILQTKGRPSACTCETPVRSAKVYKGNHHPTVKPIDLMRYLVRMVTPKKGIVLDPYCGSGTTLIGAKMELINYIGIELDNEYCQIAEARIAAWNPDKYLPQQLF